MNGKVLKIANNDLYGNVDERKVVVFATFIHKKYMNKYTIFTFENDYDKKKIYLASTHLKENSLVTFNIKSEELEYINKFINDYLDNKVDSSEFEIIDISNINKIELVSYYQEDFEKLNELDKLSIKRDISNDVSDNTKKSYGFLYFILVIMILLLIGITYLYFNPNIFAVKLKKLDCTKEDFNAKVELNYFSEVELKFNYKDELERYHIIDTYSFNDKDKYLEFKDNNYESKYFDIDGSYKYDDNNMTLKLIYDEKLIIYNYEEVFKYLQNSGYTCIEGIYDE